jgi:hypothetical protein
MRKPFFAHCDQRLVRSYLFKAHGHYELFLYGHGSVHKTQALEYLRLATIAAHQFHCDPSSGIIWNETDALLGWHAYEMGILDSTFKKLIY